MMQKIKCLLGYHEEVHKIKELMFNYSHTFECKHCGKIFSHFCIAKENPVCLITYP